MWRLLYLSCLAIPWEQLCSRYNCVLECRLLRLQVLFDALFLWQPWETLLHLWLPFFGALQLLPVKYLRLVLLLTSLFRLHLLGSSFYRLEQRFVVAQAWQRMGFVTGVPRNARTQPAILFRTVRVASHFRLMPLLSPASDCPSSSWVQACLIDVAFITS